MIPAIHTDVIQELVGDRSHLVRGRQFLLDNYIEEKKQHKKGIGRTPKAVPVEELKFELYLPLHELWKEYITELLGRNFNEKNIAQKIVKADLHGALISVWKSSCKSYEGQKGIVLQETMKSFRVITRDNKVKTFLKQDSIFLIEIADKIIQLFGEHFQYRPTDRAKIKFKQRDKLKLLYS